MIAVVDPAGRRRHVADRALPDWLARQSGWVQIERCLAVAEPTPGCAPDMHDASVSASERPGSEMVSRTGPSVHPPGS